MIWTRLNIITNFKCFMIDNIRLQKRKEILLVKEISKFPDKKIIYKGSEFDVKELVETIYYLFYKKGSPISTAEITDSLHFSKAEKFVYKVMPHLHPDTSEGLVNSIKIGRRYLFYPSGIILKPNRGEVLDFTPINLFYDHLKKISEFVKVNICNPEDTLSNFLKLYDEKDHLDLLNILVDIAKTESPNLSKIELERTVSNRIQESKVNEKTVNAFYNIGNLRLPFVVWFGTGNKGEEFTCNDIFCEYINEPLRIPKEMQTLIDKKIDEKRKKADETGQAFDNNPGYRLLKITPTRLVFPEYNIRRLQLRLTFSPTNFYTSVATNQSIDELSITNNKHNITSLRKIYVKDQNLNDPTYLLNSKLANMFGIALATITEDNKILLQKRSQQVFMRQTKISLVTAENMIREVDLDEHKNPDIFATAKRCLREEVGLEIKKQDCVFLGFGVRLDNLLPQALGLVKLKTKSSELTFTNARDRWEGSNFMEDFSFEALKNYFNGSYLMSATAKLTILLALINQYSYEEIEQQAKTLTKQELFRL